MNQIDLKDYTTIGEAFKIKSGVSLSAKDMNTGPYPVYGGNGINAHHSKYLFEEPKIIIGRVGAYCGNVQYSKPQSWITDNALYIVTKLMDYDDKYLLYLLRSLNLNRLASQSGQPLISFGRIKDVQIPLPPLTLQKKIAAILDTADAYRQKTKALIEKYEQLTQSLFLEMFGDPVRNEKGWEMKKLGEVGICERGKSKHRPRNAPELLGGAYPLIQTGDIANSGGYIKEYKSTYSEQGLQQSRMWPAGTLCITIAANIAKTGILTFDACFPDSVVGFRPYDYTNNEFVQVWMRFLQKIIEDKAPESAQKNINLKILRELEIICPPRDEQINFAKMVNAIETQKEQVMISISKSESLFRSLLQRAFKGELVV